MKNKVRNICIGGGIALIALFSSCKNFMQGGDTLAELEKSIDYANSQAAKLEIVCSGDIVKKYLSSKRRIFQRIKTNRHFRNQHRRKRNISVYKMDRGACRKCFI